MKTPTKKEESEFGKGFVYNLILFAAHFDRNFFNEKEFSDINYQVWFNGASDHLYDLVIPKKWENTEIGKKAKELQEFALELGHGRGLFEGATKTDFEIVVSLTKEIAFLIDKKLGAKPVKGEWE